MLSDKFNPIARINVSYVSFCNSTDKFICFGWIFPLLFSHNAVLMPRLGLHTHKKHLVRVRKKSLCGLKYLFYDHRWTLSNVWRKTAVVCHHTNGWKLPQVSSKSVVTWTTVSCLEALLAWNNAAAISSCSWC